ncbi:hypothetical protein AAEX37_01086 [Oligella sp. MSHR50489EDL]|uniref:hypothetical protein n=1 Tax=Oligella sp. MSHR50489EDL TaxID=3139409 RepID=UPI003D81A1E3
MNVDDYLNEVLSDPNKRGKLIAWKDDILKLRLAGCTYAQIVKYLDLQGIKTSLSNIHYFCKNHINGATEKHQPLNKSSKPDKTALEAIKPPISEVDQVKADNAPSDATAVLKATNKTKDSTSENKQADSNESERKGFFRKRRHASPIFPMEYFDSKEYQEEFAKRSKEIDRIAKENMERDTKIAESMGLTLDEYQKKLRDEHQAKVPQETWITGKRITSV